MLTLKYRVRNQDEIVASVPTIEAARSFLLDHAQGKIPPYAESFGSRDLLTVPTIYDASGKTIARLHYNGTIYLPQTAADLKERIKSIMGPRPANPLVTRTPQDRGYHPKRCQLCKQPWNRCRGHGRATLEMEVR